jgi:hypothetical protein
MNDAQVTFCRLRRFQKFCHIFILSTGGVNRSSITQAKPSKAKILTRQSMRQAFIYHNHYLLLHWLAGVLDEWIARYVVDRGPSAACSTVTRFCGHMSIYDDHLAQLALSILISYNLINDFFGVWRCSVITHLPLNSIFLLFLTADSTIFQMFFLSW